VDASLRRRSTTCAALVLFCVSCSDKIITGSFDKTAKLWDAETGTLYHTYRGHSTEIVCLSFDPHGTTVATGSMDNTAKLWDVETGAEKFTLTVRGTGLRGAPPFPPPPRKHTHALTPAPVHVDVSTYALGSTTDWSVRLQLFIAVDSDPGGWELGAGAVRRATPRRSCP
jgi:WD40 repeat protein